MKKGKYRVFAAVVAFVIALTLCVTFAVGCSCNGEPEPEPGPPAATVSSITLDTSGVKKEFDFGDTFTSAGLKVTAKMSDDTTQDVPLADCRINPPNMQQPGEQTVVVTHTASRKTASYKVTVKQRAIDETPLLEITGENADSAYRVEAENINMAQTAAKSTAEDGSFVVTFDADGVASGNKALTNYGVSGNFFAFVFTSDKAYTDASLSVAVANRGAGVTPIQNNLTVKLNEKDLSLSGGITPNTNGYVWREVFAQGLDIKAGNNVVSFDVTGGGVFSLDYIDIYVGKTPVIPENKSYVEIAEATTYVQEAESDLNLFDFVPQPGFSEPKIESSVLASGGQSIGGVGANSTFTVGVTAKEKATVRIIARMAKYEGGAVSEYASFTFDGEPIDLGEKRLSAGYGGSTDTMFFNWNDVVVGEFNIDTDKTYDFTFNTPPGAINIDALKFAVLTYGAFATDDEKTAPTPNAYIDAAGKTVVEAESLDASAWKNEDGAGYGEHSAASGGKSIGHLAGGSVINVNVKLSDKATVLVSGYMAKYENDYVLADNVEAAFDGNPVTLPETAFGHAEGDPNPFHNWKQVSLGRYDLEAGIHTLTLTVKEGKGAPNIDFFEFASLTYGSFTDEAIAGIAITEQPTKTLYSMGETFDPAGMKVMLTGANGTNFIDVTGSVSFSQAPLTAEATKVTISYGEFTADVEIAVTALAEIRVKTPPTKTEYAEGERFDPAGMVVEAVYVGEESPRDITGDANLTYNKLVKGDGVTLSYSGRTVAVPITVTDRLTHEVTIGENGTFTVEAEKINRDGVITRPDMMPAYNLIDGEVRIVDENNATGGKLIEAFAAGTTFTLKIKTNGAANIAFGIRMAQGGTVSAVADFTFNGEKLTPVTEDIPVSDGSPELGWYNWGDMNLGSVSVDRAGEYTFICTTKGNFCFDNFTFTVTDYAA